MSRSARVSLQYQTEAAGSEQGVEYVDEICLYAIKKAADYSAAFRYVAEG